MSAAVHSFVEQRRVFSPYERFRLGLVELALVMALGLVLVVGSEFRVRTSRRGDSEIARRVPDV